MIKLERIMVYCMIHSCQAQGYDKMSKDLDILKKL